MDPSAAISLKTAVFLSYSRRDADFAVWLGERLETKEIEVYRDLDDTLPGEEWWARLQELIRSADTIVFVLSPHSAVSPVCADEVKYALGLSKRIFPVVLRDVDWTQVPDGLAKVHSVFFTDKSTWDKGLDQLASALLTDVDWVREHTRLQERAHLWLHRNRSPAELLRGRALEEAERWLASQPSGANAPTTLHSEYIAASRDAARKRRNAVTAVLAAGLILSLALAGAALWQRNVAQTQRAIAEANESRALEERDQALLAQSRLLAGLALDKVRDGDAGTAVLLALEALPNVKRGIKRPYAPVAEEALLHALNHLREKWVLNHDFGIWNGAFSRDGRLIAITSGGGTAEIWDVESRRRRAVLKGHGDHVEDVAFSPDGRLIATASFDHTARLWDVETGAPRVVLAGHADRVYSVAFSKDGRRLVTGSQDRTARVWDVERGTEIATLKGHTDRIISAAFDDEGSRVVTGSWDNTARVWDLSKQDILTTLRHEDVVRSVAFHHRGDVVLTASDDRLAREWRVADARDIGFFRGHAGYVTRAVYDWDHRLVLTASRDRTLRIWRMDRRSPLGSYEATAILAGHDNWVTGAVFRHPATPDGRPLPRMVLSTSPDGTARLWEPDADLSRWKTPGARSGTFSRDGRYVILGLPSDALIIDAASGREVGFLRGHDGSVLSIAVSPDGLLIATGSADKMVRLWNAKTRELVRSLTAHEDWVVGVAFSPDGLRLVSASYDHTARVWDLNTGTEVAVLRGHQGQVTSASFSPDGRFILTSSDDRTAKLWDTKAYAAVAALEGHRLAVNMAAFSPDGNTVAMASGDRTVGIWDVVSRRHAGTLEGHEGFVRSVQFSPDGRRLVTASQDGTLRFWDLQLRAQVGVLRVASSEVDLGFATYSPDGRNLLSVTRADKQYIARMWPAFPDTADIVEHAISVVPRCLTEGQRKQVFLDPKPPSWCRELGKWPY
jgi:WD40 repeat protein